MLRIDEATLVIRAAELDGRLDDMIILPDDPATWAKKIAKGDDDMQPIVEIRITSVAGIGLPAMVFSPRDDSRTGRPINEIDEGASFALCLSLHNWRKLKFLIDSLLEVEKLNAED